MIYNTVSNRTLKAGLRRPLRKLFCFYGFYDLSEHVHVFGGKCGENFAIKCNVIFLERVHKLAVGKSEGANSGIDADLPHGATFAFFAAARIESVLTGFHFGDFGQFDL